MEIDHTMSTTTPRIFVVANRLPVTVTGVRDGKVELQPSSGGLVSVLQGLRRLHEFVWYGWPGLELKPPQMEMVSIELKQKFNAVPVWLPTNVADKYYGGFANSILWPLLHYNTEIHQEQLAMWPDYVQANHEFARALAADLEDHDVLWIHDFHLMLLPRILRELRPRIKIVWFLHTPFPSYEVFRILPTCQELLDGILYADVVGFQTLKYAKNFADTCRCALGTTIAPDYSFIDVSTRSVKVEWKPVGIDPQAFRDQLSDTGAHFQISQYRSALEPVDKVILGVDRVDHTKGLLQKMTGFARFLTRWPDWVGRVTLVQVAVPSRTESGRYRDLMADVRAIVNKVNVTFGRDNYRPIELIQKPILPHQLAALYALADACFVSALRDGLNLVALEFIACQNESRGVLILSEFTGLAQLLPGCLLVNPWDQDHCAGAILRALTMDETYRESSFKLMSGYVSQNTSVNWYHFFMNASTTNSSTTVLQSIDSALSSSPSSSLTSSLSSSLLSSPSSALSLP